MKTGEEARDRQGLLGMWKTAQDRLHGRGQNGHHPVVQEPGVQEVREDLVIAGRTRDHEAAGRDIDAARRDRLDDETIAQVREHAAQDRMNAFRDRQDAARDRRS